MNGREEKWDMATGRRWPVLILGGGITGASFLRLCSLLGIQALLLEKGDFASGTSSWSSKLVHGGMRYLQQFQLRLSHESIRERDRILRDGRGLVRKIDLLYATYRMDPVPRWMVEMGLAGYGMISKKTKWPYKRLGKEKARDVIPGLNRDGLTGLYQYWDAQSDDCGLVMRVLREARELGGIAINFAKVHDILRSRNGRVCAVGVRDETTGNTAEIEADVVVNATGPWSDRVRSRLGLSARLRPLRGSHLILPESVLPLHMGVFFSHPSDGRFVFAIPWMGRILLGSTDLDHDQDLDEVPVPSEEEVEYILEGVRQRFCIDLDPSHLVSAFAGVRPVIRSGRAVSPSRESREHAVWAEDGLVTVTGGKLTTFSVIAWDTLKEVGRQGFSVPGGKRPRPLLPIPDLSSEEMQVELSVEQIDWLLGRYGSDIIPFLQQAGAEAIEPLGESPFLCGELTWACREDALGLEDLLLRRTRVGLLEPKGGQRIKQRIKRSVAAAMGWSDDAWEEQWERYVRLWDRVHSPARLERMSDRAAFE